MANTIQLKRRVSGVAGAPSALKSGEIAHNEVDDTLYVGKGDDGAGNATAVIPLAGKGAFVDLTGPQSITGAKTFTTPPKSTEDATGATDLVRKSQLDAGLAGRAALSHAHAIGEVTGLQAALDTLEVGGRLVVISFHSLEDRIVKLFMRKLVKGEADNLPRNLPVRHVAFEPKIKTHGKAQTASDAELKANPRSRSAVMRVAEKLR